MSETREDILRRQITIGDKAERAYNLWLKGYIDLQYVKLFEEFKITNIEDMPLLQHKIHAMNDMELVIKSEIESARMAKQQLGE